MAEERLSQCRVLDLPRMHDVRGNLTFVESHKHVPFDIKRVFYIYDVPTAEGRGAHAHKTLQQFMVCLSGGFEVELNDGLSTRTVKLNRPWQGLLVPPMVWASEGNFNAGSVCLVLASELYDESDYIREWDDYLKARGLQP